MEQSYEARGENLGRRKKPKISNYSGKFLSLPCEIVALRFLRICLLTTQPFILPALRDKRNLDSPFSPWLFFENDCNICYRQQRCSAETFTLSQFFRSAVKSKYQGLLTFRIRYKVLTREGNSSLLALISVNISQDKYINIYIYIYIYFCVFFFFFLRELH